MSIRVIGYAWSGGLHCIPCAIAARDAGRIRVTGLGYNARETGTTRPIPMADSTAQRVAIVLRDITTGEALATIPRAQDATPSGLDCVAWSAIVAGQWNAALLRMAGARQEPGARWQVETTKESEP